MRKIPANIVRARRGLSFAELIIGMMITGLIMAALAAFISAVAVGWKQTASEGASQNTIARSGGQMRQALGGMLNIAQIKEGGGTGESSYVFYWKNDSFGNTADKKAQLGEMGLLEYDPATQAIWVYEAKPESSMTAAQKTTAASDNWGDATSPAVVTYFKTTDILAARKPVVGGGGGTDSTKVTAAKLTGFIPAGGRPMATYDLTLDNAGKASAATGAVVLRSSQAPSNFPTS